MDVQNWLISHKTLILQLHLPKDAMSVSKTSVRVVIAQEIIHANQLFISFIIQK